jgi:hypothetical protein
MELTTTNTSDGICIITDDLLTTAICSRLDRPARDALRRANKKYFKLILSQDELNKNYKEAYTLKDKPKIIYWKNLGGLLPHQELANAIQNKKCILAAWLLRTKKVIVWDAYCCNIQTAVNTSTIEEILPVIKWLLDTQKPLVHLGEFLSGYHYAANLVKACPEVQKIVNLFMKYEEEEERKANTRHKSYFNFGGGPWHARSDYY